MLAVVFLGPTNGNVEAVAQGLARVDRGAASPAYPRNLRVAERKARRNGVGLWGQRARGESPTACQRSMGVLDDCAWRRRIGGAREAPRPRLAPQRTCRRPRTRWRRRSRSLTGGREALPDGRGASRQALGQRRHQPSARREIVREPATFWTRSSGLGALPPDGLASLGCIWCELGSEEPWRSRRFAEKCSRLLGYLPATDEVLPTVGAL